MATDNATAKQPKCPACRRDVDALPNACKTPGCGAAFCAAIELQMHVCTKKLDAKVSATDAIVAARREGGRAS